MKKSLIYAATLLATVSITACSGSENGNVTGRNTLADETVSEKIISDGSEASDGTGTAISDGTEASGETGTESIITEGGETDNAAASSGEAPTCENTDTENENSSETAQNKEEPKLEQLELKPILKTPGYKNPCMTQRFGADPYALVYDGRVYIYMTGDEFMYDKDGKIIENNYSNIWTLRVISSDDLVNWTDHGEVYAASKKGAATWGGNSWAPAAAWKMIDGKPKFFLYFANSGNGIAVLTSDTPYGPFTDPIGQALISRATPTCAEVAWLFDPAVLMDDDGQAYIYFGGGIPSQDKIANPGTARVAKLGADMISLDGDPVPIANVEYLFEDSGINKINGKYVYSYCSNFNVPAGFKFDNGEIITMVSDNPMGPFTYNCGVLKNPGAFFGQGGNNHHCMFEFGGRMYITYHARLLEDAMGNISSGYRSTNIDYVNFDENGQFLPSKGTKEGVEQVKKFNPFVETSAVTVGNQSGNKFLPFDESAAKYGSGKMILATETGSWTGIYGADFGDEGAAGFEIYLRGNGAGKVHVRKDFLRGDDIATVEFTGAAEFTAFKASLNEKLTGEHNIYFIFEGEGLEAEKWTFMK